MNYEVLDLLEVGSAGSTIQEKLGPEFDEVMDVPGPYVDAVDE